MKFSLINLVAFAIINISAAALLGGFQDVKNDDPFISKAVSEACTEMNKGSNAPVECELISAQYQIVAGTKYLLKMKVTGNGEKLGECNIEATRLLFPSGVWTVESKNSEEVCHSMVNSKETPTVVSNSGRVRRSAEDLAQSDVQDMASWAVDHINQGSNSMYRQGLQEVLDVARYDDDGQMYRFLLHMVTTTCRNRKINSGKGLDECPAGSNPMHSECDVFVKMTDGKYSMPSSFHCKTKKVPKMLGGDDHDYKPHGDVKPILGGDDHDYKPHRNVKPILGGDDHDYKPHGNVKPILGGDDHDYKPHRNVKPILGGDDHDYKPHGDVKPILGGDDHDYKPHRDVKPILGGDNHDYKPHRDVKPILGGDDHDYKTHALRQIVGQDIHDYIPHLKSNLQGLMKGAGKDMKDKLLRLGQNVVGKVDAMRESNILGGDAHDYQPHGHDLCHQYHGQFEEFKAKHQRLYGSEKEESERFQIFCGNMEKVKEYQKMERGSAVYGATQFADISEAEFKAKYLGWNMNSDGAKSWPSAEIPKGPVPDAFDWRDHNAVTPVKNQGSCGSCWAFSTTGNIEGVNAIKHKKLVSLSEQELLDCDKVDLACNGGLPTQAYEAIIKLGGIETEKDYGYEAEKETCHFDKSEVAVKLTGALNISQDEGDMAAWLVKNGPISIGINAFAMQFYFGGIAHPWKMFCNPSSLDHGVLIVGFGKQGNEPYWIIKNSWGPGWGREGYYYVYRGDGTCGLNKMCTSAIVE